MSNFLISLLHTKTLAEMSREVKPVRPWESGMQFSQEVWEEMERKRVAASTKKRNKPRSSWPGHYTPPANQPAFYNQYHVSGYMQPFRPSAASFQPIVHPSFRSFPSQVNSVNSVNEQAFRVRAPPRIPLGERSNISHVAASDEVEVKIQRKMAVLMEDRFIEEEVQRRLAKDNEPVIKRYAPDANKSTHAKPSVMPSTGNPDEYSGDMNLDKEQLFSVLP